MIICDKTQILITFIFINKKNDDKPFYIRLDGIPLNKKNLLLSKKKKVEGSRDESISQTLINSFCL